MPKGLLCGDLWPVSKCRFNENAVSISCKSSGLTLEFVEPPFWTRHVEKETTAPRQHSFVLFFYGLLLKWWLKNLVSPFKEVVWFAWKKIVEGVLINSWLIKTSEKKSALLDIWSLSSNGLPTYAHSLLCLTGAIITDLVS